MRATRRNLIGSTGAVVAMAGVMRKAQAAQYRWRFGHSEPISFPLHIRLVEASERIKAQSGGRMDLQIFPNGQLGGDNDLLSQVRSGAIQFAQPTAGNLSTILPVAAISGLGFAWSGYDKVWPAMDGDLGKFVRGEISARIGLVPMERMWDLGFRQITTSTRPVRAAADLAGMKIRVPVSATLITLFRALRASPLPLQFPELYPALQTRLADGQETPLALIFSAKLYEVQKYCSLTNHIWDGHWMCCNAAAWRGLPDDLRTIVADNLNQSALDERADIARLDESLKVELQARGLVFNAVETKSFQDRLRDRGFYKYWHDKLGDRAWQVLQKYAGPLAG